MNDPYKKLKDAAKLGWATFAMMQNVTGTGAPKLVRFAGVTSGADVLDVGCGTGVVALAAARVGANVTGLDLTPELLAHAKENAAMAEIAATWVEGDAEALPFPDERFDFVVSQFGHMFAPRPEVAVREMLRVLKPGGTIAFSTWPPELFVARMFAITAKYAPPLPEGVPPVTAWGDPATIRVRLGNGVHALEHERDRIWFPTLSPQHARAAFEVFGPGKRLVAMLAEDAPDKMDAWRREVDALAAEYFVDNRLRQEFLMTRARKS